MIAHRVDRLVRRPGGHEHAPARERPGSGASSASDGGHDLEGLAHPAGAALRLRHGAVVRARRRRTPSACRTRRGCAASPGAATCARSSPARRRTGSVVASSTVEARSSAWPPAIFAMRFAVAGATTTRSASRASRIWPISASSVAVEQVRVDALARRSPAAERRDEAAARRPSGCSARRRRARAAGGSGRGTCRRRSRRR